MHTPTSPLPTDDQVRLRRAIAVHGDGPVAARLDVHVMTALRAACGVPVRRVTMRAITLALPLLADLATNTPAHQ